MASVLKHLALRACRSSSSSVGGHRRSLPAAASPLWSIGGANNLHGAGGGGLASSSRAFSSTEDPYKALGVDRGSSEADIKKAYKEQALKWHPDRNPDNKEAAQKRFTTASNAYDILKDPDKKREYDTYGRTVGGGGPGGPGGFGGGHPGGFHGHGMSQADAEKMFREIFGQQGGGGGGGGGGGMDDIFRQMMQQSARGQQQQGPGMHGMGGGPRRRQPGLLEVGMEVQIRADVEVIHRASRSSGIDAEFDGRRAECIGKIGTIVGVDPKDQTCKVQVMVQPGRAAHIWFGAGAVEPLPEHQPPNAGGPQQGGPSPGMGGPFDGMRGQYPGHRGPSPGGVPRGGGCGGGQPRPQGLQVGMEIQVKSSLDAIEKASRACGIDAEFDDRRARCAGKLGTIVGADPSDQSIKVRVMVLPGRADEVWFGAGAVEPIPEESSPEEQRAHASA